MTGEPTHIELGTTDPAAAMAFYGALLGWSIQPMPGGGMAQAGPLSVGFHGGDPLNHHEVFYSVDDLETSMTRIGQLGGSINGEIHDSPGFGRWVECTDDQGAHFGIVVKASPPA